MCTCVTVTDRDTDKNVTRTWRVLEALGLTCVASDDDVAILRYLASAVSIRAAQIVGACKFMESTGKGVFTRAIYFLIIARHIITAVCGEVSGFSQGMTFPIILVTL